MTKSSRYGYDYENSLMSSEFYNRFTFLISSQSLISFYDLDYFIQQHFCKNSMNEKQQKYLKKATNHYLHLLCVSVLFFSYFAVLNLTKELVMFALCRNVASLLLTVAKGMRHLHRTHTNGGCLTLYFTHRTCLSYLR